MNGGKYRIKTCSICYWHVSKTSAIWEKYRWWMKSCISWLAVYCILYTSFLLLYILSLVGIRIEKEPCWNINQVMEAFLFTVPQKHFDKTYQISWQQPHFKWWNDSYCKFQECWYIPAWTWSTQTLGGFKDKQLLLYVHLSNAKNTFVV